MVVAQLVERSLPIPEVISKIYIEHLFTVNCVEKTKINKKRLGMAYFLKKKLPTFQGHTILTLKSIKCLVFIVGTSVILLV